MSRFIAQFSTDIRHLSGAKNVIADALSRIETVQIQPVDYSKLSQAQINDPQLKTLMRTQGKIDIVLVKLSNIYVQWRPSSIHSQRIPRTNI